MPVPLKIGAGAVLRCASRRPRRDVNGVGTAHTIAVRACVRAFNAKLKGFGCASGGNVCWYEQLERTDTPLLAKYVLLLALSVEDLLYYSTRVVRMTYKPATVKAYLT